MATTITKPYYNVTVKTAGGNEVAFNDSTHYGDGIAAWMAVSSGEDIRVKTVISNDDVWYYIPFHAIDTVDVIVTPTQVQKPEDDICPDESDAPGGDDNS